MVGKNENRQYNDSAVDDDDNGDNENNDHDDNEVTGKKSEIKTTKLNNSDTALTES